jgi:hypothetical protein
LASGNIELNPYQSATNWSYYSNSGNKYNNNSSSSYGDSWDSAGDIIGVAFDADNGVIWFSKNGTWQNSATASEIAAGTTTNAAYTGLTDSEGYVCVWWRTGGTNAVEMDINFGTNPSFNLELTGSDVGTESGDGGALFKYAPPTGFKALTTSNMPDITIGPGQSSQADDHFNTVLFTGDGSSSNAVTGVGFQPDWVWIKSRNNAQGHLLTDSVRGATKRLQSDATSAEDTSSGVTSFDSDGFTMGSSYNQSSYNQVSWNWKAGGSASSNSDGTITSSVSANQDAGFSIISWTGAGADGTIGHGLTQTPEFFLTKDRNNARNWEAFHKDLTAGYVLYLNLTNAQNNTGSTYFQGGFSASGTNDTTIALSSYLAQTSKPMIGYAFHSVEGYSKFGSYFGNGNSSGTYVYTGFRPAWVMVKRISATENWRIQDSKRLGYNPEGKELYADLALVEASNSFDIVSNGFKIRNTSNGYNASGSTYIYLAFAEAPFKFANGR